MPSAWKRRLLVSPTCSVQVSSFISWTLGSSDDPESRGAWSSRWGGIRQLAGGVVAAGLRARRPSSLWLGWSDAVIGVASVNGWAAEERPSYAVAQKAIAD